MAQRLDYCNSLSVQRVMPSSTPPRPVTVPLSPPVNYQPMHGGQVVYPTPQPAPAFVSVPQSQSNQRLGAGHQNKRGMSSVIWSASLVFPCNFYLRELLVYGYVLFCLTMNLRLYICNESEDLSQCHILYKNWIHTQATVCSGRVFSLVSMQRD